MVPGEDLLGPVEYGVDGVVVLGCGACLVQVSEPIKRFESALEIIGLIEAVELLQGVPGHL